MSHDAGLSDGSADWGKLTKSLWQGSGKLWEALRSNYLTRDSCSFQLASGDKVQCLFSRKWKPGFIEQHKIWIFPLSTAGWKVQRLCKCVFLKEKKNSERWLSASLWPRGLAPFDESGLIVLLLLCVLFWAAGTSLPPHHAAAGSDATVSPVLALPLPAVPEPHQSPRYQTRNKTNMWRQSLLTAETLPILGSQGQKRDFISVGFSIKTTTTRMVQHQSGFILRSWEDGLSPLCSKRSKDSQAALASRM